MPPDNELTGVSEGQPFMEFLSIMINKLGLVIASEVISGMLELSCNPASSHLSPRFLFLKALFCLFLLIWCPVQAILMNSALLIGIDNRDYFVSEFLISAASPKQISKAFESPFSRASAVAREHRERLGSRNLVYVFGHS